jgi:hypothetical protein
MLQKINNSASSPGGCLGLGALVLTLGAWYAATGKNDAPAEKINLLPDKIAVTDTDLPFETLTFKDTASGEDISKKFIDPAKIDFNRDFRIKTDHYEVIKYKDDFITRCVGHAGSCVRKLFFWDSKVGWGMGDEGTRGVISMLEHNKEIDGITVRLNHNGIFKDCLKLFVNEETTKRNNIIARVCIGLPETFIGECYAGFSRSDYYNPMTGTAVIYSDVQAIAAHEIGHHKDFRRFSSDWEYSMVRPIPPVTLYQEWQASSNAKGIMPEKDQWQFYRYLIPAFATYVLGCYALSRKVLQKAAHDSGNNPEDISVPQVLRHMTTSNASFMAGVYIYSAMITAGAPFLLAAGGFAGGAVASNIALTKGGKALIPYEHE